MKMEQRCASVALLAALVAVAWVTPSEAVLCYDCYSAASSTSDCISPNVNKTKFTQCPDGSCHTYTAPGYIVKRDCGDSNMGCALNFCNTACRTDYCNDRNAAVRPAIPAGTLAAVLTLTLGLVGFNRLR